MGEAGRWALQLPVRTALDLRDLARMWRHKQEQEEHKEWKPSDYAAGLARDMVENLVAESDLTERACKLIRERLIFEDAEGRVCLDLRGDLLGWRSRSSEGHTIDFQAPNKHWASDHLYQFNAPKLVIPQYYGCQLYLREGSSEVELPPRVSGWLMILWDILKSIPDGVRMLQEPGEHVTRLPPLLMQTEHAPLIWREDAKSGWQRPSIRASWPLPCFDRFSDYERFARNWEKVTKRIPWSSLESKGPEYWCSYLFASWVDIGLAVFRPSGSWSPEDDFPNYAREVLEKMQGEYDKLSNPQDSEDLPRTRAFRDWLERYLFLLLQPEFMWTTRLDWTFSERLSSHWRSNYARLCSLRWDYFREALLKSGMVEHYCERLKGGHGLEYMRLHKWINGACNRWFTVVDNKQERLAGVDVPKAGGSLSPVWISPADAKALEWYASNNQPAVERS